MSILVLDPNIDSGGNSRSSRLCELLQALGHEVLLFDGLSPRHNTVFDAHWTSRELFSCVCDEHIHGVVAQLEWRGHSGEGERLLHKLFESRGKQLAESTVVLSGIADQLTRDRLARLGVPRNNVFERNLTRSDTVASRFPVRAQPNVLQRVSIAIKALCTELCRCIAEDGAALDQVDWRKLEEVVAEALDGIGFDVTLTPESKDGGKDVIAQCVLAGGKQTYYVEIKHWRSGKMVGPSSISDFVEVNVADRTDGGLFLSTSGYTSAVLSQLTTIERQNVILGGKSKVVALCREYTRSKAGAFIPNECLPRTLFCMPSEEVTVSDEPIGH